MSDYIEFVPVSGSDNVNASLAEPKGHAASAAKNVNTDDWPRWDFDQTTRKNLTHVAVSSIFDAELGLATFRKRFPNHPPKLNPSKADCQGDLAGCDNMPRRHWAEGTAGSRRIP